MSAAAGRICAIHRTTALTSSIATTSRYSRSAVTARVRRLDTPTDVAVVWLDGADADTRALSLALLVV
jgi:hypothetical protein